jgi:hypothetical protein
MKTIMPVKSGLTLGFILALYHAVWAALVATGLAQAFLDFIFWAHFLKPVLAVDAFSLMRALLLLAVTGAIGFVVGVCFALVWNRLHRLT